MAPPSPTSRRSPSSPARPPDTSCPKAKVRQTRTNSSSWFMPLPIAMNLFWSLDSGLKLEFTVHWMGLTLTDSYPVISSVCHFSPCLIVDNQIILSCCSSSAIELKCVILLSNIFWVQSHIAFDGNPWHKLSSPASQTRVNNLSVCYIWCVCLEP